MLTDLISVSAIECIIEYLTLNKSSAIAEMADRLATIHQRHRQDRTTVRYSIGQTVLKTVAQTVQTI